MKGVAPDIIQEIDRKAIEYFLLPRLVLMENAGRLVAENAINVFKPQRVTVICGCGFNGGDGLVAARYFCDYVKEVKVILLGGENKLKAETKINLEILKKLKVDIIKPDTAVEFKTAVSQKVDLIIDAIIGIGLKSEIKGFVKEVIEEINRKKTKVLAVDIPSGLSAWDGTVNGAVIKADLTITFTFPKTGMYLAEGPKHCGRIKAVDIGIPRKIIKEVIWCFPTKRKKII